MPLYQQNQNVSSVEECATGHRDVLLKSSLTYKLVITPSKTYLDHALVMN